MGCVRYLLKEAGLSHATAFFSIPVIMLVSLCHVEVVDSFAMDLSAKFGPVMTSPYLARVLSVARVSPFKDPSYLLTAQLCTFRQKLSLAWAENRICDQWSGRNVLLSGRSCFDKIGIVRTLSSVLTNITICAPAGHGFLPLRLNVSLLAALWAALTWRNVMQVFG